MSKESVSALIKAIQATTDLFVSKGLTRRQQLVSKTSDDSYVQDLEDVYSSGIDTIVENIPDDPPPTPPTPPVETITGYFNPGQGNAQMSVPYSWGPSGDNYEGIYPLDSDQGVPYDSSKTYIVKSVFYADGTEVTDENTLNRSVQLINSPFVSGWLLIRTKLNNKILGNPCGCTYTEE